MEKNENRFLVYFLKKLKENCHKFRDKTVFKFVSTDKQELTYFGLFALVSYLSNYFLKKMTGNISIGLSFFKPNVFIYPIIIALWKNKCSVVPIENIDSEIGKLCKINFVITDQFKSGEKIEEFQIGGFWFYLVKINNYTVKNQFCFSLTTSGSTGIPTIVRVPWSCILPNAIDLNKKIGIKNLDVIYCSAPLSFDPFFENLLGGLLKGCTFLYTDFYNFNIKSSSVTVIKTTPRIFNTDFLTETVRIVVLGGEVFPVDVLIENFKNISFFNIYGITELSCWGFLHHCTKNGRQPLGKPLNSVEYKIENGNLFLGSKRKCLLNNEIFNNLEKIQFRKTNDLVEVINNEIYFISRSDKIIKYFGKKVNLSVIENEALSHPDVKNSICIFNQKNYKIYLIVILNNPSEQFQKIDLIIKNSTISPDEIFSIKKFPITKHGKINKNELILEINKLECNIKSFENIWKSVLNLNEIDENKSFINCGGGSFQAVKLIEELKKNNIFMSNLFITKLLDSNFLYKDYTNFVIKPGKNSIVNKEIFSLALHWQFFMEKCVDSTALSWKHNGEDRVVIGSHSGLVVCLKVSNGELLWRMELPSRVETQATIDYDFKKVFIGCHDHYVYCLDAEFGNILWKFETLEMVKGSPCITIDNRYIFFGSYDNIIYKVFLKDGLLECKKNLNGGSIRAGLVCCSESSMIFVVTLNGLCGGYNFDLEEVWKDKLSSPIFSTPSIINGLLFVIEVTGVLHCMLLMTGSKLWTYKCNENVFSPISYYKNDSELQLAIGCHNGTTVLLTANLKNPSMEQHKEYSISKTSTVLKNLACRCFRYTIPANIFASPCFISKNKLLIFATNGQCYIIDNDVLQKAWTCNGDVYSTPILINNYFIVFGSRDNNFNCLRFNS